MKQYLDGTYPSIPKVALPYVAVNDVARAHILAMENFDISNGNRYICSENTYPLKEIFGYLKHFKQYGYKVPTCSMKYCTLTAAAIFKPEVKEMKPFWGRLVVCDHDKICKELNFEFTPIEKPLVNMAYECIKRGIIKDKTKGKAKERDNYTD